MMSICSGPAVKVWVKRLGMGKVTAKAIKGK
jgi:hypothetical protein